MLDGTLVITDTSCLIVLSRIGALDLLLVVDDLKARQEAARLNIRMTGTLGILFRAKEKGAVPKIAPLIAAMEKPGFRVAPAIVGELLRKASELN